MLDFQQKRKVRAVMYHKATLICLALILLFVIHSTWVVYKKKKTSEEIKSVSLRNVTELQTREKELESRIERLQTEPGIEEEIRSKFTVAKAGENMVIVVDDDSQNTSTTSQKLSFWQKIWNIFSK